MAYYIYYLLTVIGIGYLITQSDLVQPLRIRFSILAKAYNNWFMRKLDGVINCIYCCSFWIGLPVYVLMYEDISFNVVFSAFSVMGLLYIIHNLFNKK